MAGGGPSILKIFTAKKLSVYVVGPTLRTKPDVPTKKRLNSVSRYIRNGKDRIRNFYYVSSVIWTYNLFHNDDIHLDNIDVVDNYDNNDDEEEKEEDGDDDSLSSNGATLVFEAGNQPPGNILGRFTQPCATNLLVDCSISEPAISPFGVVAWTWVSI